MKKAFFHKNSIVETPSIGSGSRIWAFAHILKGAAIGRNANICDHCFIEGGVIIGDDVTVKCGVWLWDGITVEDNVFIGPSAVFTNDRFPRSGNRAFQLERTLLSKGCSIGANATILAGVRIGKYAMVGAGSVVTADVPDFGLVYGNPARLRGYVCECGGKLEFRAGKAMCGCGKAYRKSRTGVERL